MEARGRNLFCGSRPQRGEYICVSDRETTDLNVGHLTHSGQSAVDSWWLAVLRDTGSAEWSSGAGGGMPPLVLSFLRVGGVRTVMCDWVSWKIRSLDPDWLSDCHAERSTWQVCLLPVCARGPGPSAAACIRSCTVPVYSVQCTCAGTAYALRPSDRPAEMAAHSPRQCGSSQLASVATSHQPPASTASSAGPRAEPDLCLSLGTTR